MAAAAIARRALRLLTTATLSLAAIPVTFADPFKTRDQNPLTTAYGQPLPTAAALPAESEARVAITLDIGNSINPEDTGSEALLIDYESRALTLSLDYGIADRWALRMELPLLYRGAGRFDHFIDQWHQFWGLPRGERPNYPDNQYRMQYANSAGAQFDITESGPDIGDVQLGVGYQLRRRGDTALSLWASVELPTGNHDALTGSGSTDYSLMLAAGNRSSIGRNSANLGVVFPGGSMVNGLETETAVIFGHLQGGWDVNETIELKIQFAGHTGYYSNTRLEALGSAVMLVFGGRVRTGRCSGVDIGFSEDIRVGASPDITFLLSWTASTGSC